MQSRNCTQFIEVYGKGDIVNSTKVKKWTEGEELEGIYLSSVNPIVNHLEELDGEDTGSLDMKLIRRPKVGETPF